MALNAKSDGERSVSMALFNVAAQCAGIAAGQVFQASDAPRYETAWTVVMSLACVGVTACALTNVQYWWLNRYNKKRGIQTFVYSP
jgi:hypothetical protein